MSTYMDRYKAADNGLRFQGLVYQGNFKGMDPVPDGILGDKVLRQRAKSKVLEKVTKEDVLRDQFTVDELNDLNNYLAWNIWDVLVMRATEGVSGMIPRQEYEMLLGALKERIRSAQLDALRSVNREQISLYTDIGLNLAKDEKTAK